jgi:precorrin-2 dehydrogenase/sirohydrochlorin ferrochelatase/precorrin-6A/cobalt-precorrin-6A reductase
MTQRRILIFGGTTEGRLLFEQLQDLGIQADLHVATAYGKELVDEGTQGFIESGRLDAEGMVSLFQKRMPEMVVDATHPYAVEVTKNLKSACETGGIPYLRLNRAATKADGVILCESIEEAVEWLDQRLGAVLSTIGSKGLRHLTGIRDYENRVYARILPLAEAVEDAVALGFKGNHLICMQGPFSVEMNLAMLRQYKCEYLLTKDSGASGGFEEKLAAAKAAGVQVVLVGRPSDSDGLSYEQVLRVITGREEAQVPKREPRYFPMYVNLCRKRVLVVGGGKIAARRIETLLKFDCDITVVSPEADAAVLAHCSSKRLTLRARRYTAGDLESADMVLAVTNDRKVNRRVGLEAKALGIPVSVADAREECAFYFPAIVEHDGIVIGLSSQGQSHHGVSALAKKLRWILNHED